MSLSVVNVDFRPHTAALCDSTHVTLVVQGTHELMRLPDVTVSCDLILDVVFARDVHRLIAKDLKTSRISDDRMSLHFEIEFPVELAQLDRNLLNNMAELVLTAKYQGQQDTLMRASCVTKIYYPEKFQSSPHKIIYAPIRATE